MCSSARAFLLLAYLRCAAFTRRYGYDMEVGVSVRSRISVLVFHDGCWGNFMLRMCYLARVLCPLDEFPIGEMDVKIFKKKNKKTS